MAYQLVHGIVLRYANYKDYDRMLTIFTQEAGRVDACARGCRRPKSPLLPCAQPFVFGEFQLYSGKGRNTVNQCDVRETFYPLREDMAKFQVSSMMLSLTAQTIQEGAPNPQLFSLLYYALSFLCYGEIAPIDAALSFLLRFFTAAGVCPTITACAVCNKDVRHEERIAFSPMAGGAVCASCASGRNVQLTLSALTMEAARRIICMDDAQMENVRLPGTVRRELFTLAEGYGKYHFERENQQILELKQLLS